MAKWIEWIPEQAHGVLQQLMKIAGKHSGVIWLIEPPPNVRCALTPVGKEGVERWIAEGGLPVGWIDKQGHVHTFRLDAPFDPPNFSVTTEEGIRLTYEQFYLDKQWVARLYEEMAFQNHVSLEKAQQARLGNHDS